MTLPHHLSKNAPQGEVVNECIAQYEIGSYKNFVYLILDWSRKKAAWVDPQSDLSQPLECLQKYGFELTSILLTHTHHDHIAGVPELARTFPQVPIYVHSSDAHRLKEDNNLVRLHDGQEIQVGDLKVISLHTPGHSAGECSYFLESTQPPYLLTGDTVFIRDCGRTDLATGSNPQMFESLQRIKKLPASSVILPGHHYHPECASTLEVEISLSPPFQCKSVDELAQLP